MKISILVSISVVFCILRTQAQDITGSFRMGLSASLENNLSEERVNFSEYTGFSADYNKTNYRLGLNMEYGLKNDLTINGSIQYSNKDFTRTYFCDVCDFAVLPSPEPVDFSFIEVPLP